MKPGISQPIQRLHAASYVTLGKRTRDDSIMIATAFTAIAPYPPPPPGSATGKDALVRGLLSHFNVPDQFHGPVPVITDVDAKNPPTTIAQAMASIFAKFWAEAIIEEWLSILGNDTWDLVEKEPWMKVIPCKWVFVVKPDENGVHIRFKARLVAGGHRQTEGVDYDETFAPVSRLSTLRTLLAVSANRGWRVHQIDIKTAFLHADIDTDVYMRQPPGLVCRA